MQDSGDLLRKTKVEHVVMKNPELNFVALSVEEYVPLKPLFVEGIQKKELEAHIKRHLERVVTQWNNSATKSVNEATSNFFQNTLKELTTPKMSTEPDMFQVIPVDEEVYFIKTPKSNPRLKRSITEVLMDDEEEDLLEGIIEVDEMEYMELVVDELVDNEGFHKVLPKCISPAQTMSPTPRSTAKQRLN